MCLVGVWLRMGWLKSKVRSIPLLLWWLILFIEALVLSPNIKRKGANNSQFERGQLVQLILTKAVFACQRLWW